MSMSSIVVFVAEFVFVAPFTVRVPATTRLLNVTLLEVATACPIDTVVPETVTPVPAVGATVAKLAVPLPSVTKA